MDLYDRKGYVPNNKKRFKSVLLVSDNFSKFGWTVSFKSKPAQTKKDSFKQNPEILRKKMILIKTDGGKKNCEQNIQQFFWQGEGSKNIVDMAQKWHSLPKKYNRTIRIQSKKVVFEEKTCLLDRSD